MQAFPFKTPWQLWTRKTAYKQNNLDILKLDFHLTSPLILIARDYSLQTLLRPVLPWVLWVFLRLALHIL